MCLLTTPPTGRPRDTDRFIRRWVAAASHADVVEARSRHWPDGDPSRGGRAPRPACARHSGPPPRRCRPGPRAVASPPAGSGKTRRWSREPRLAPRHGHFPADSIRAITFQQARRPRDDRTSRMRPSRPAQDPARRRQECGPSMPWGREGPARRPGVASVEPLADRPAIPPRPIAPWADASEPASSASTPIMSPGSKIELRVTAAQVPERPAAGRVAARSSTMKRGPGRPTASASSDLHPLLRPIEALEGDGATRPMAQPLRPAAGRRGQDVDRARLRLAPLLAAPGQTGSSLVRRPGDQSIYGWRAGRRAPDPRAGGTHLPGLPPRGPTRRSTTGALRRAVESGPSASSRQATASSFRQSASPGRVRRRPAGSCWRPDAVGRDQSASERGRHESWPADGVDAGSPGPDRTASCCRPSPFAHGARACRSGHRGSSSCWMRPQLAEPLERARVACVAGRNGALLVRLGRLPSLPRCATRPSARPRSPTGGAGQRALPCPAIPRSRAASAGRRSPVPAPASPSCAATTPVDPRHGPRHQGPRVRPRRGRRAWRSAGSRAAGPSAQAGRPGPRLRGGTPPRLRRLDPGAPLADPPVRPGGPLPVPARGVHADERASTTCGPVSRVTPRPVELSHAGGRSRRGTARSRPPAATSRTESLGAVCRSRSGRPSLAAPPGRRRGGRSGSGSR